MTEIETKPLQVEQYGLIGDHETKVIPFEPGGIDWAQVNKIRLKNPTYGSNVVPDALVRSCSECCMEVINGHPNTLGRMWRKVMTKQLSDGRSYLDCGHCPVGCAGDHILARNANGQYVLDRNGKPMTQTQVMYMEIDDSE